MSEQMRIIDINEWWRTGGIDPEELKMSAEVVIIQAYNGRRMNPLLKEQVDLCNAYQIPYETYAIPNSLLSGKDMADLYLDLYGVLHAPKWADIEPSGGTIVTQNQAWEFIKRVNEKSQGMIGYYSNYPSTNKIGNPSWIREMSVWWAEYPLYFTGLGWSQYRTFTKFLQDKPWWPPKWAAKLGIAPILHQFTDKGLAQQYGASATTNDPKYKVGIKSADLNVSLVSYEEYIDIRFGPYINEPEEDPCPKRLELENIKAHLEELSTVVISQTNLIAEFNDRLLRIEEKLDLPDEEPEEVPWVNATVDLSSHDKEHTVAWGVSGWKTNKKTGLEVPIIDINLFAKTNDPAYRFEDGEIVQIKPRAINADGAQKFHALYGYSGDVPFIKKEHVRKYS